MDMNDYWQENKRFLVTLGSGFLVFLIGLLVVQSLYGEDLGTAKRLRNRNRGDLKTERYSTAHRDAAGEENDALREAIRVMSVATAFRPRPGFVVEAGTGSASGIYFTRVEEVREDLDLLASRRRMNYPDGWGIEMLETNSLPEIERRLEALDLLERVARLAADAGVDRISRIAVRLDPGFGSRSGLGAVERTTVTFTIQSSAESVTNLIVASQESASEDGSGGPLAIGQFHVKNERNKIGTVKAEIEYQVVRIKNNLGDEEAGQ
jgi:hypothetical protein